jgi:hypothetical protein
MFELDKLMEQFSISGLKASFEDEGAHLAEVNEVIKLAHAANITATVKIGGAEARSDIQNCTLYDVDNIVAPMIETKFAAKKFVEACKDIVEPLHSKNFYINIETVTATKNAKEIIEEVEGFVAGIVVGRSDLSKSLKLTKSDTNSEILFEYTKNVFELAKNRNLQTTMGGNLNSEGFQFVKSLWDVGLLDRVETRLVICNVDQRLIDNYQKFISLSIELEKRILQKRLSVVNAKRKKIEDRIKSISGRSGFLKHVNESEKFVLVIDFDNVIHNMTMGYHNGTIYGRPIKGTEGALKKLAEKYKLVVYTCKANPNRPLVNGKTGTELICAWLEKNNLSKYIDSVTFGKPNAVAYIDDKALEFTSWESCLNKMIEKGLL